MPLLREKNKTIVDTIYDNYSASIFGIILRVSKDSKQAEEILIQTFQTFFLQNPTIENGQNIFMQLLKTTICIASEKLDLSENKLGKIIIGDIATAGVGKRLSFQGRY